MWSGKGSGVEVESVIEKKIMKLAERFFYIKDRVPHQHCPTFAVRFRNGIIMTTEVMNDDRFNPSDVDPA